MFGLFNEEESAKFNKWNVEHKKTCKIVNSDVQAAIGGRLTYCFTPTSLGTVIRIECACGEEVDVTDYSW